MHVVITFGQCFSKGTELCPPQNLLFSALPKGINVRDVKIPSGTLKSRALNINNDKNEKAVIQLKFHCYHHAD